MRADEIGDEGGARPRVDLARRPICTICPGSITAIRSPSAIASDWSCVTYTAVMPRRAQQRVDLGAQLLAQLGVERSERLVEQQHARTHGERAGEGDALALAAGQLVDAPLAEPSSAPGTAAPRLAPRVFARASNPEALADVLGHVIFGNRA